MKGTIKHNNSFELTNEQCDEAPEVYKQSKNENMLNV